MTVARARMHMPVRMAAKTLAVIKVFLIKYQLRMQTSVKVTLYVTGRIMPFAPVKPRC